jgi:hypothetical protein
LPYERPLDHMTIMTKHTFNPFYRIKQLSFRNSRILSHDLLMSRIHNRFAKEGVPVLIIKQWCITINLTHMKGANELVGSYN